MTDPITALNRGTWRTYSVADGLPGVFCEHVAEDRDGNIWIAMAENGACRFDGNEFVSFTKADGLCGNQVFSILLDSRDRLWFGTVDGGLCYCEGAMHSDAAPTFHQPADLATTQCTFLYEDSQGRVWWGGLNGFGYYADDAHCELSKSYLSNNTERSRTNCRGIVEDNSGDIWLGLAKDLLRYDGDAFHTVTLDTTNDYMLYTLAKDAAGQLWVGTRTGLLWRGNGREFTAVALDIDTTISIRKLQFDRQNRLWLATTGHGVLCYQDETSAHFTTRDGLTHNAANAAYQSRDDLLFFATFGGGLCCCDPVGLRDFELDNDEVFNAERLHLDGQGRVWLTSDLAFFSVGKRSDKILGRAEGGVVTWFGTAAGLDSHTQVLGTGPTGEIFIRKGEISEFSAKIGGKHEPDTLLHCRDQDLEAYPLNEVLGKDRLTAAALTGDDTLFLGMLELRRNSLRKTRLCRYSAGKFEELWNQPERLFIQRIIPTTTGELFFSLGLPSLVAASYPHAEYALLAHWSPTQGVTWFDQDEGLPAARILDLLLGTTGEDLWVATWEGLCHYDGTRFHTFTRADGLPSDHIYSLCRDRHGRLWIGTDAGISLYDGHIFQSLDSLDLGSVTAIVEDHDGVLWFATPRGIKLYTPSAHPPRARVVQIVADRVYGAGEAVRFPASVPQVLFECEGLSFRTPARDMLYTHRLIGHDEEWSKPNRSMRAFYRELTPDDYTFESKVIDRDLNESAVVATTITVVPDPRDEQIDELERRVRERTAQYESANAQLSESNAQLAAANQEVEKATQRKSAFMASMSHDLRTPMNAIIGYTRILLRRTQDALEPRLYQNLENIETSSNNLLALINEILDLSRIESGRVELKLTDVDLRQLAKECAASVEPLVKDGVLLQQQLQTVPAIHSDREILRRVLINLLGNAVKFTEAGSITLSVRAAENGVEVSVTDTGVGIPPADLPYIFEEFRQVQREGAETQGSGLGLAIVKKSVELLGGTIAAESEMGQGTRFILRIGNFQS